MKPTIRPSLLLLFTHVAFTALSLHAGPTNSAAPSSAAATRPANWAVKLDWPHLSNLYQVSSNLYRGAQPTADGIAELKARGMKTIIDLRNSHSDPKNGASAGLKLDRVPMVPWTVNDGEVVRFLRIVADTNNLPVFVHCERGADRTGMMCAMYRIAMCGWTKDEAIKEMTEGGYHFSEAWQNIIRYVRGADIEKLKRAAGIDSRVANPTGAASASR